jgi:hypothetical protein
MAVDPEQVYSDYLQLRAIIGADNDDGGPPYWLLTCKLLHALLWEVFGDALTGDSPRPVPGLPVPLAMSFAAQRQCARDIYHALRGHAPPVESNPRWQEMREEVEQLRKASSLGELPTKADWSLVCTALRMLPTASAEVLVERIDELRGLISETNAILAPYCAEVDPGRCPLDATVKMLEAEVLKPQAKLQEKLRLTQRRVRELEAQLGEGEALKKS